MAQFIEGDPALCKTTNEQFNEVDRRAQHDSVAALREYSQLRSQLLSQYRNTGDRSIIEHMYWSRRLGTLIISEAGVEEALSAYQSLQSIGFLSARERAAIEMMMARYLIDKARHRDAESILLNLEMVLQNESESTLDEMLVDVRTLREEAAGN